MKNKRQAMYIGIRLSPELYQAIFDASQDAGRSMSFIVRELVSAGVANRGRRTSTAAGKRTTGGRHG